jgi:hypothetical protein
MNVTTFENELNISHLPWFDRRLPNYSSKFCEFTTSSTTSMQTENN